MHALDWHLVNSAEVEAWPARLLRPQYTGGQHRRALLSLSPDGGDAKRVREFDLDAAAAFWSRALGVGKPFQAIWHVASQHPLPAARRRF